SAASWLGSQVNKTYRFVSWNLSRMTRVCALMFLVTAFIVWELFTVISLRTQTLLRIGGVNKRSEGNQ
ncbi:MAG: hypothetical protein NTW91_10035, partial [Verrucomicrobia bacterium]|nr:hypothetical protein [Verrucomicrobiota bacterium]